MPNQRKLTPAMDSCRNLVQEYPFCSALGEAGCETILVAGTIDSGTEPLWAKTDPGNGFSAQRHPCDTAASLGARP